MYNIGDCVVYPIYGAGTIVAVEEKEILGENHLYYILELPNQKNTVMIPVNSCDKIGIRELADEKEIDKLFAYIKNYEDDSEENWNKKYRRNMDKIKSGDLKQVGEVIKYLLKRENVKPLSAGEKKMLGHAKQVLYSEINLRKKITFDEIDCKMRSLTI